MPTKWGLVRRTHALDEAMAACGAGVLICLIPWRVSAPHHFELLVILSRRIVLEAAIKRPDANTEVLRRFCPVALEAFKRPLDDLGLNVIE